MDESPSAGAGATTAAREGRVIKKKGPAVCDDRALKAANSRNVKALNSAPAAETQHLDVQSALSPGRVL